MRTVPLALALAGALTVALVATGCSTAARPGVAAVVDGTEYSASEVDGVARQLTPLTTSQADAAKITLQLFIVADGVRDLAAKSGGVASREDAKSTFGPQFEQVGASVNDLDDTALDVLATSIMANALAGTPEGSTALTDLLRGRDVEVNPRYGTASTDGTGQLVLGPVEMPWLASSAPSAPAQ